MRAAATRLQDDDPARPITPGRVFLALGARPQCGSCVELVRRMLRDWGFPPTCPEPLASIADETDSDDTTSPSLQPWEIV